MALLKDPVDRRAAQLALEAFEDSGVALPKDRQARAKAIADKLSALSQQFNRNIRDARTRVAFTEAELKGVPESVWKDQPRDADGKVTLPIDGPAYASVMQTRRGRRRARAPVARQDQRGRRRQPEAAGADRAAAPGAGQAVRPGQLRRVRAAPAHGGDAGARREVPRRRARRRRRRRPARHRRAARRQGAPPRASRWRSTRLQRWDTLFYSERLQRDRFAVDDEAFRPYFPPQESLRFVMRVAEKMFGVRYDKVDGAATWAPDVQAWAVTDVASNRKIATLYVDPYPRDGKYNHAAVWNFRNGAGSVPRQAQSALVVNFDRRGLTLRELETLMHEFGHTLRNNLSATRYASDAGENVAQDFAEAPSQMLEDWVYDKKVLKVFQEVCADVQAGARRAGGQGARRARLRQGHAGRAPAAVRGLRPGAARARGARSRWRRGRRWRPRRRWATWPARRSRRASRTWPADTAPGITATCGARPSPPTCAPRSAPTSSIPRSARAFAARCWARAAQKPPQQVVKDFLGRDGVPQAFFDWLRK